MEIVKRAIIMAAGKGNRMYPITLKTPKPLIEVNGKRMIETIIDALHINEIEEIYIVVGYLKRNFDYLLEKYSNIHLIDNPYFESCNNISSLYVARNYLENSIIIDGDQIIYDASILDKRFIFSGYNCVWTNNKTNEWLLEVDNNNFITDCHREGGEKGWQLFSVSRWNKEDGNRLKRHLEIEFFEKKNTQIYWDDIALFCYPDQYKLSIKKMSPGSIIEIDNFSELVLLDDSYAKYKEGEII